MPLATLLLAAVPALQEPLAASSPPPKAELLLDQTLAIVNDQVITFRQVFARAQYLSGSLRPDEEAQDEAFAKLLLDLLFQEGFRIYNLEKGMVDRLVQEELDKLVDHFGSVSALNEELARMNWTMDQERKRLERLFTALLFRQVELGFSPAKGGKGFNAVLTVSPEELREFYRERPELFRVDHRVGARILLLRDEPGHPPAAQRMADLRRRIAAGEIGFADAARQHSLYKPTAGGSTGLKRPKELSTLAEPIREFLAEATQGTLSEVLELPFGTALVLAEKVQQEGVRSFEEVQARLQTLLRDAKANQVLRETINRLRQRCYLWGDRVGEVLDGVFPEPDYAAALSGSPAPRRPS